VTDDKRSARVQLQARTHALYITGIIPAFRA
jgi:hypothetical protein